MKLLKSLNFTLIEIHEEKAHGRAWGGFRGLFLMTDSTELPEIGLSVLPKSTP